MRNSKENLIIPFYKALLQDFESLLPDESFQFEKDELQRLEESSADDAEETHRYVKNLSLLGKSFEKSLVQPVPLVVPVGFQIREGSCLPELFYGLFQALFHESGLRRYSLADANQSEAKTAALYVLLLRQYLLAFSKVTDIEVEIDQQDEIDSFVERVTTPGQICALDPTIASLARRILRIVLMDGEDLCAPIAQWVDNPWGRHGPGAVSGGEEGTKKWFFSPFPGLTQKLFEYMPGMVVTRCYHDAIKDIDEQLRGREPARLAIVPKDFRGHRLICIEPKEQQFAQQGLMQVLTDVVKNCSFARRAITFDDQSKSARLSADLRYATIDLKDASDSLKIEGIRVLFPEKFYRIVSQLRSSSVMLPDGDWITPRTEFTMGNALCFPIETLVFWSVSLATMIAQHRDGPFLLSGYEASPNPDRPDRRQSHEFGDWSAAALRRRFRNRYNLRVYGDDIIVPLHVADAVTDNLTRIGCTVNLAKTCIDTLVRESCGSWFWNGIDVRITRFRYHKLSSTRVWISVLANVRELQACGLSTTSLVLLRHLAAMHPVPFGTSGFPGQMNVAEGYRWNKDLQRLEFRMPVLCEEGGLEVLPGYAGLYAKHTQQATRAVIHGGASSVKWIWAEVRLTDNQS